MKSYRSSSQIMADVLYIIGDNGRGGVGITKLCHKSNLPHGRLKKMINLLTTSELTNKIEYDGKNTFVLTPKGKDYLENYKRFASVAETFGLDI
tara:strand:+ start:588 stop:869 length:282 start_codon:yes stop_codon:yes gene_type:complete